MTDQKTTPEARKVRTYPVREKDGDGEGYVTACTLACAQAAAEHCGHVLFEDAAERAEDEDEQGVCDGCHYPDLEYMSPETIADLTPEEQQYVDGGEPADERSHAGCGDCKGRGIVKLYNPDGTWSGDWDACDGP